MGQGQNTKLNKLHLQNNIPKMTAGRSIKLFHDSIPNGRRNFFISIVIDSKTRMQVNKSTTEMQPSGNKLINQALLALTSCQLDPNALFGMFSKKLQSLRDFFLFFF